MLYKRSLVLASATHGWLPRVEEALPVTVDLAPLQAALMQQGNTVALDGDPVRLAQVFVNLLDNASKYTPEGGVIELTVATTGNELVITVIDSGIGITTESMATMFDPFVQDPQAVAFNANGLGIGLTVVRELVDAHGGKVTAWSEGIGAGSRFTVSLPLGEDSRPADR
jgi:signal transduction histidine kinase